MIKRILLVAPLLSALIFFTAPESSLAWLDETHLAVAQAAGYSKWYNATAPEIAIVKAPLQEPPNHYYNGDPDVKVTPELVLLQANRYNDPDDQQGHLYGAIIGATRAYRESLREGKYAEAHLAYLAHYVGDLSQPLHNAPHDDFNKARHLSSDGILEKEILGKLPRLHEHMSPVALSGLSESQFEQSLAEKVAEIANHARELYRKMRAAQRDITVDEAYIQLGRSASLLQAVLLHLHAR